MSSDINFLNLQNVPIWEQLELEEALLRNGDSNWCIVNKGTPPAIVMGISGKLEELVDLEKMQENPIPIWRRFSGGGTVVVDNDTVFVTFICNSNYTKVPGYPHAIHSWIKEFYLQVFSGMQFELKESDYVFGDRKFGGNAQYICKDRWLHHTSFLWDYNPKLMEYLHLPSKRPKYRETRSHHDFLCTLKEHFIEVDSFFHKILSDLKAKFFVTEMVREDIEEIISRDHRKGTIEVQRHTRC